MSRARHHTHKEKHRAEGGATETGGNPHVFALAKEKTSIGHIPGTKSKTRLDRKRGGACHASGGEAGMKGSDTHPYTSAHKKGGAVHHGEHHPLHHGLHGDHEGHHAHHKGHTMAHEAHGGAVHHEGHHSTHHPHHEGHKRGRA